MNFAKKILEKYGWKEGNGIGKNNNGIVKPLKASLKFDNTGLGSDAAATDFNNHWWQRVYNEASLNINVHAQKDGVLIKFKDESDGVEISTKSYSIKKLKKIKESKVDDPSAVYGNFLQASTLTKEGEIVEIANRINAEAIAIPQIKLLTDEQLFRACGGRTAHKGARHGLKLNGKISRLEKQDQELLAKMANVNKNITDNGICIPKRKSKKVSSEILEEPAHEVGVKAKRKKFNETVEYNEEATPTVDNTTDEIVKSKIKKKTYSGTESVIKKNKR